MPSCWSATARRSASGPARCHGSTPHSSPYTRRVCPATRPMGRCWDRTPTSRSAMASIRRLTLASARSCSRAAPCATERSSRRRTNAAWRWYSPASASSATRKSPDSLGSTASVTSFTASFFRFPNPTPPTALRRAGRLLSHTSTERMATATNSELDYRPSYRAALAVSLATLVLYLLTLAPSTAMWDTSEYIAAAYTLGLPHPPGNPLFVIIGRVFSILPIASTVAVRINILAAICSAVSAGMWFLVTERVLVSWFPERWQRVLGGALAALIGATAFTVWNQSVVNEKVYTVSLVGIAVISWLMIRWSDEPDGPKADRILVLVAYLCGLGYSNHMAGMLAAPAVGVAVLVVRPRTIIRWKLLLACLFMLGFGLTPFATQPIRAAYFPAINEGEPTACRTKLELSCTFSRGTYDAFNYNFNRGQYGKPDLSDRQASFGEQIGMWWLYFKWQWIRDAHSDHPFLQALFAAAFLVLGLFGGWVHFQRDRRSFWYFGSLMFTMTLVLIYYLNFKLGASQDPASQA